MPALDNGTYLDRYAQSLMGVYGRPKAVLARGQGCYVWDVEGNRYLDLLAGIAVNALGHAHPAVVGALSRQAASLIHVSNIFATAPQIELAERLLTVAGAPAGSSVFFANSGTEAIEAAIKLSRRTGRCGLVAAEGAFHGRTTGALALTHKQAYREPFEPLIPSVTHVPLNDETARRERAAHGRSAWHHLRWQPAGRLGGAGRTGHHRSRQPPRARHVSGRPPC